MKLTPRQSEIAELVAQGLTNKEIGKHIGMSPKTVQVHLGIMFARLGVVSRKEITARLAGGKT
jgi:DNA-binding CsgD family transcriptional regulator